MIIVEEHGRLRSVLKWSWFEIRAARLRWSRSARNLRERFSSPLPAGFTDAVETDEWAILLGESVTPLWTTQSVAEEKLVAGKVRNLRIAAAHINGTVLVPTQVFSFWSTVGAPWRLRGFVQGRELREGCLVASVGGGLCQLSNALHLAALEAGMTIVERHAHSKMIPGSIAATGRDATVFWNYKDLRFLASVPFVIDAGLTATHLVVRFRTGAPQPEPDFANRPLSENAPSLKMAIDCFDCRHRACIYHPGTEAPRPRNPANELGITSFPSCTWERTC